MRRVSLRGISVLSAAVLGACGGTTTNQPPDATPVAGAGAGTAAASGNGAAGGSSGSGAAAAGGTSGIGAGGTRNFPPPPVACRSDLPSSAEIEATPRALPNLEQLALKLSDGVVAQPAIYDRVVRNVMTIRAVAPELADIEYFPPNDGRGLELTADDSTFAAIRANFDDGGPWSCLDTTYFVAGASFDDSRRPSHIAFILKGIYDMERVAEQYAEIPGILSAEPAVGGGDGSTICLTQEGDTWHYVFDRASGDCPAGCIDHVFTHFSTDSAGNVTSLGTPTPAERAVYASAEACR